MATARMFSDPWTGGEPQPTAAWLGTCAPPVDTYQAEVVIHGQVIPWPRQSVRDFQVRDYSNVSFLELKSTARARRMTEWKLSRKLELVEALERWDQVMENTTQ